MLYMPYIYSSHFSDHYIVSVSWINSTAVSAIWMNRNQNLSVVVHCMQQNHWKCHEVCTSNRTILISFNYLPLVLFIHVIAMMMIHCSALLLLNYIWTSLFGFFLWPCLESTKIDFNQIIMIILLIEEYASEEYKITLYFSNSLI